MTSRRDLPALSAVLIFSRQRARAQRALDALCAQTAIGEMEIVVIDFGPEDAAPLSAPADAPIVYIRRPPDQRWDQCRFEALSVVRAPIVAFIEDHCFASPGWATALLRAHQAEEVAVVGYAFHNANPETWRSRCIFLSDYGLWAHPQPRREVSLLPGNNVSYKRACLQAIGPELETILTPDYETLRQLRARGYRLMIEPDAQVAHANYTSLLTSSVASFNFARLIAAKRARGGQWSGWRRGVYAVLSPLSAPAMGLWRLATSPGGPRLLTARHLPLLAIFGLLHAISGLGETIGFLCGEGRSPVRLNAYEVEVPRGRT
jgi:hypothetical protein